MFMRFLLQSRRNFVVDVVELSANFVGMGKQRCPTVNVKKPSAIGCLKESEK